MADILDCVITKVGPEAEISKRILGAFEDRDYIYAFEILEEVCESNNKDYKECVNKYSTKKKTQQRARQSPSNLQSCIAFYYPEYKECGKRTTDIMFTLKCRDMYKKGKEKCQNKN